MIRPVLASASVLGLAIVTAFGGCSSSSTSATPHSDAGLDTGITHHDSGSGSGGNPGDDGSADDGTTGDDGGGGSCPDDTAFTPQPYKAPTANQGVCTPAQTQSFITECVDSQDPNTCNTWFTTNVASEGGAGTPCGNCIFEPTNNGGTESDPNGFFEPNYFGCIAITDTTSGAACAPAFQNVSDCEGWECDDCADGASYGTCAQTVDQTDCASYTATEKTACTSDLADGGAFTTCSPSSVNNGSQDLDFTYIINLICGGGDGGGGDGGGATDAPSGG